MTQEKKVVGGERGSLNDTPPAHHSIRQRSSNSREIDAAVVVDVAVAFEVAGEIALALAGQLPSVTFHDPCSSAQSSNPVTSPRSKQTHPFGTVATFSAGVVAAEAAVVAAGYSTEAEAWHLHSYVKTACSRH